MKKISNISQAHKRSAGVWLVCTYLLLTETIAIAALVSNWSSSFGKEVFGPGVYADPDWIHFALIVTNTFLWLAVALNLYRMSRKAVRLLGIAFAVGVVDIYRQATYGWVAHQDRAQYLVETGAVIAFIVGAALLIGIVVYIQALERRGVLI